MKKDMKGKEIVAIHEIITTIRGGGSILKTSKPKVSIIIPVYNAGNYLKQCLDSVVNQTLKDIEIIIINDGSTDNSASIISDFANKYGIIKEYQQENAGVISARIEGYKRTCGEYIGWVDADDFCDPIMYETLYTEAKKENADVVSCNYNFFPKHSYKAKWYKDYKGVVDWKFIERNTIQWNKIVKRELLEDLGIEELLELVGEGCYENVLIKAKKIITINKCLYNYRVGHTSTSTNWRNYDWFIGNIKKNINQLGKSKNEKYDAQYIDYFRYRLYYSVITALIVLAYNGKKDMYKQYKTYIQKYDVIPNRLNKEILDYNYSVIKSAFFRHVVPHSYLLTRFATSIFLRN